MLNYLFLFTDIEVHALAPFKLTASDGSYGTITQKIRPKFMPYTVQREIFEGF